ncbi:HAD family hydrolase [Frateuria aurantia]|uniref:Haloacid dehalogenase superfamily protein, subfamily IA, variant 3 with third motif having DD or ED n=1 Tax=Frateuria aurantia (strain ATCC 33424 / DSM 6220 / KCTC 2777 / LMG 1558 / NBRC 3245 / NCIMB 13370) TaxID=767434 RepID=H8L0R5_FRAAD|nr:HAD family phosphatase [Frateuria aurantia]AFC85320.1 haloacid dehalogenase superfamily protein, subfamily IA, variant 3 with third motif having DD or ED [Frateuria aurantia DSM 6220]
MPVIPFEALLFDCDGVLVDSEPLVNAVLVEMLGEMGWSLDHDEALERFTGTMVRDHAALILEKTGVVIDPAWEKRFRARRDQRLQAELQAIPGARQAVAELHRDMAGRMAVASGADIGKVRMQLDKTGIATWFDGQVFSGQDLAANKPAPDIYLHAARQLGADPARSAVVEDSLTGIRAGVAAGATVFGYLPATTRHVTAEAMRRAGAHTVFRHMEELPQWLRQPL